MKILIFDGTFKTTTFINRLASGLALKHDVYIIGFNQAVTEKVEGINYIGLGSNKSIVNFILTSVFLRKMNFLKQFQLLKLLLKGKKKVIHELNLQIAIDTIQTDILHFHWVSILSCLTILEFPVQTQEIQIN